MLKNLFSIPIFQTTIDKTIALDKEIKNTIDIFTNQQLENPWCGNIKSTFSWHNKNNLIESYLPELSKILYKNINLYLNLLEIDTMYLFTDIIESWMNFSYKDMYQEFHMHPDSDLSGVLYCKVPTNSGDITFVSPSPCQQYHRLSSKAKKLMPSTTLQTFENLLLIFPSYLEHMVMPNKNDDVRISIAFNVKLIE